MLMEPVIAPARWWLCGCLKCVSGLRRLEETKNFLRCIPVFDRVLKCGSDINERNWLQVLFYFILLMGIVTAILGISFCSCVSRFRLKFSRIALWWKRLQLDSRSDIATNGSISGFFVQKWLISLTSYLSGLQSAPIAQILFVFDENKIFRFLVWGVFWSFLQKCLYFFAAGFCKIDWLVLGMQCNFTFYLCVSSSLFFLEVVVKFFNYFWKPYSLFSKFCVNCLLIFYFVYCNNCALKDVGRAC